MKTQKYLSIGGYCLFTAALLCIIAMSLSDYTAEQVKLEKVRKEYWTTYCKTITADIYKCNAWEEQSTSK